MAWVRRNCRQLVSVCRNRRRWDAVALEDPPDRRGADAVAELEQLALDPLVSPARVLRRHPYDQRGEHVVDRWAPGSVRVGPLLANEAAMPAQDRVRGDQAMAAQCSGQPPDRVRRTRPGRPSPGVVWGWCGGARRPRAAARAVRCPWWRTGGPAARPASAPAGRADTAAAATRRRSCPTADDRRSPLVSGVCRRSGTPQARPDPRCGSLVVGQAPPSRRQHSGRLRPRRLAVVAARTSATPQQDPLGVKITVRPLRNIEASVS